MLIELGWAAIHKVLLTPRTGHAYWAGCKLYKSRNQAIAAVRGNTYWGVKRSKEQVIKATQEAEDAYHFVLVKVEI